MLYHDSGLKIDWNQIHLCELEADGFHGFGREFEAALREDSPDAAGTSGVFTGLDRMRTVPRWTFNDAVVEARCGRSGRQSGTMIGGRPNRTRVCRWHKASFS